MEVLIYLVPMALGLGLLGLAAFLWSLKSGQYDDLDGAAWRAIMDDEQPTHRSWAGGTNQGERLCSQVKRDTGPVRRFPSPP